MSPQLVVVDVCCIDREARHGIFDAESVFAARWQQPVVLEVVRDDKLVSAELEDDLVLVQADGAHVMRQHALAISTVGRLDGAANEIAAAAAGVVVVVLYEHLEGAVVAHQALAATATAIGEHVLADVQVRRILDECDESGRQMGAGERLHSPIRVADESTERLTREHPQTGRRRPQAQCAIASVGQLEALQIGRVHARVRRVHLAEGDRRHGHFRPLAVVRKATHFLLFFAVNVVFFVVIEVVVVLSDVQVLAGELVESAAESERRQVGAARARPGERVGAGLDAEHEEVALDLDSAAAVRHSQEPVLVAWVAHHSADDLEVEAGRVGAHALVRVRRHRLAHIDALV